MCTSCGVRLNSSVSSGQDHPSGLLNLAVCCFPLLGLILYFIWREDKPKSAKSVCKWAIVGFVLGIVLYIAGMLIGALSESMYYY
ncbi:hypothetical protein BTO28_08545 [Domibacillus epiphyticus]|uniref:Uncharacterized protein n=2 Tax=Domibacillus epiphyticus TaxID=1714355 RepID=A0A1V2A880_9BACI|nr:hypothetical protein BTO28_08545 [Domibacillus epiphyticus]